MSLSYRIIRKLMALPSWLSEGEQELVGYSIGYVQDVLMRRLELGILARFPQNGPTGETAPPDALVAQGRDRRVFRGIFETEQEYAEALLTWLDERQTQGNPFTLMRQLARYTGSKTTGTSFRIVDARGNWFSRAADGTESFVLKTGNWNWDNRPTDELGRTRWSRFWLIIYPGTLWGPGPSSWGGSGEPAWGADDGLCWGTDAPLEQIQTLRAIVLDWMGTGKRCVNIILAFDPASFDPASPEPDGTWEHWSKIVGGVRVPARLATARYINGVSS